MFNRVRHVTHSYLAPRFELVEFIPFRKLCWSGVREQS